jgi:hypothetical protein
MNEINISAFVGDEQSFIVNFCLFYDEDEDNTFS